MPLWEDAFGEDEELRMGGIFTQGFIPKRGTKRVLLEGGIVFTHALGGVSGSVLSGGEYLPEGLHYKVESLPVVLPGGGVAVLITGGYCTVALLASPEVGPMQPAEVPWAELHLANSAGFDGCFLLIAFMTWGRRFD